MKGIIKWFKALVSKQQKVEMAICYQCETECNYLFEDGRCKDCTRLTPEEVVGNVIHTPGPPGKDRSRRWDDIERDRARRQHQPQPRYRKGNAKHQ